MSGALTIPDAARAQILAAGSIENLQRLSIEQLANLQVTSVSKVPESLRDELDPVEVGARIVRKRP